MAINDCQFRIFLFKNFNREFFSQSRLVPFVTTRCFRLVDHTAQANTHAAHGWFNKFLALGLRRSRREFYAIFFNPRINRKSKKIVPHLIYTFKILLSKYWSQASKASKLTGKEEKEK